MRSRICISGTISFANKALLGSSMGLPGGVQGFTCIPALPGRKVYCVFVYDNYEKKIRNGGCGVWNFGILGRLGALCKGGLGTLA